MNKMPSNIDNLLSLLGEVDILKTAFDSFEQSLNIALASDEVSQLIGPTGHFHTLKKTEMVHAALLSLNVELITIAEHLATAACAQPHSEVANPVNKTNLNEKKNVQTNSSPPQNNPLVNNVLEYLDERLKEEDEDE